MSKNLIAISPHHHKLRLSLSALYLWNTHPCTRTRTRTRTHMHTHTCSYTYSNTHSHTHRTISTSSKVNIILTLSTKFHQVGDLNARPLKRHAKLDYAAAKLRAAEVTQKHWYIFVQLGLASHQICNTRKSYKCQHRMQLLKFWTDTGIRNTGSQIIGESPNRINRLLEKTVQLEKPS